MVPYAELHCKTNFSFLEGASHAAELAEQAARLGYQAWGVTDRNTLAGIVRAHIAAQEHHLPLVVGAEITPHDAPPVVLWVPDRASYGRLSRMITVGRRGAEKGEFSLSFRQLADLSDGLLAGLPASNLPRLTDAERQGLETQWREYGVLFAGRCYLLAELHRGAGDQHLLEDLQQTARRLGLPLVAAGNVHYHHPDRQALHEVQTAIRRGITVMELGEERFANAQRHLRCSEELQRCYAGCPDALARTLEVAERAPFSLSELRYEYPEELAPAGQSPLEYLRRLVASGARQRYPDGVPHQVGEQLRHELELIAELHYEAYFLTVWDLVRFARQRGILCQGRGSAANSAVCYCLGITSVDPERSDLLFERFVSRERDEAPDIDVDFEHERREEVLQYIYEKYGRERAGMTAVVITYRVRSAVRDVGKALGLSSDCVDSLAKNIEGFHDEPKLAHRCRQIGFDPDSETGKRLLYLVQQLLGFPRHLSQHVGGMVMTQGPLCELAPIENASMEGRTVIQWDKDDLDELGILKVDCLSLGMLSAIRRCFAMIEQHSGRELNLATIPAEDPRVYDMICRADTMGVFQIESRAQMSMLPRLKPRCFYDLVIEVAIVRPGPIQGQMVHPYLRRRAGEEPVTYPNEAIEQVLRKTLGVPLFQEQAMRLAVVAAGFTPGEADQLRRAMGAWRRPGIIDQFQKKLLEGMQAHGLSLEFAEQVFRQIRGFGEYGFPESHAASFALLVYASAWLKHHYPVVFTAALINSQPMGFYAPAQLIRELVNRGGCVRPLDIQTSAWDCTLECPQGEIRGTAPALRLGLRLIVGLSQKVVARILEARQAGPFHSLEDLQQRTGLGQAVLAQLADADALGSLAKNRRTALWHALGQDKQRRVLPLFESAGLTGHETVDSDATWLPMMSAEEEVLSDYRTSSMSLKAHPLSFYREALRNQGVLTSAQLAHTTSRRSVQVAGLVLLRQRPATAKGITFVTLEDETGAANLVVHPQIWERYDQVARRSSAWLARGHVQAQEGVIHLVVQKLEDLAQRLRAARRLAEENPAKRAERRFH